MTQQSETTTQQLIEVIQAIQLGRASGQLIARRSMGAIIEEGHITFIKGQVTEAKLNQRSGTEALNQLSTWGACRFLFISLHSAGESYPRPSSLFRDQIGSHMDTPPPSTGIISLQRKPPVVEKNVHTDRLHDQRNVFPSTAISYQQGDGDKTLRILNTMGFSRAHRRLFLLLNGQRTIAELVRLSGHSQEEVVQQLHDLELAHIIRIERGTR